MAKNFQSYHIWMETDFSAQIAIRQVRPMNFGVKKRDPMQEFNHKLINWPWVWLLIWLICGIRNQICIFLQILVTLKNGVSGEPLISKSDGGQNQIRQEISDKNQLFQ